MSSIVRNLRYDLPCHIVLRLCDVLPDNGPFLRMRGSLVKRFVGSSGKRLMLGRHVTIYNPAEVHFGSDVYLAYGTWIMAMERIEIQNEVLVGPYCVIVSSNHARDDRGTFRFGRPKPAPITVQSGAWLGSHVTVTAGSIIPVGGFVPPGEVVRGTWTMDPISSAPEAD